MQELSLRRWDCNGAPAQAFWNLGDCCSALHCGPRRGRVAAYDASYLTQSWDGVTRSSLNQRVLAGIKVDFGADTLKSRDREGATWDVPNVAGAVGQSALFGFCFISECYYPLDPTP